MRTRFLLLGLLGLIGVLATVSDGSAAATVAITWGKALAVPGGKALNGGGSGTVNSISCPAAGTCAAVGGYKDGSGDFQAFVVDEKHGKWGKAVEVPGTAALNAGGGATTSSVSCAAAGDCSASGFYKDGSGHTQAFVVGETNGTWGTAIEVPGTAALNVGGVAGAFTVSCAAVGDCVAGGYYSDASVHHQAFVVTETSGTWGTAIDVPGAIALNTGGNAITRSISCAAVGECAAIGGYFDGAHFQTFVVDETSGTWGTAVEIPGTAALNAGGFAIAGAVSCGAVGQCAAGGNYLDGSSKTQAFVVSETNGVWGTAVEVPGTAALNVSGNAITISVSCGATGHCVAGGHYADPSNNYEAFVANASSGTWGKAAPVPGIVALNGGGDSGVNSLSCLSANDCAAAGYYYDAYNNAEPFVVSKTNGVWGRAIEVPGIAALNVGGAAKAYAVSCDPTGTCAAGGSYAGGGPTDIQAWVVSTNPPCVVPNVLRKPLATAKAKLKAAHCGIGRITSAYSSVPAGRIVAQKPRPGTHLTTGAKVALTLSKGKKS